MRTGFKILALCTTACATAVAVPAAAQSADPLSGPYIGVAIGAALPNDDDTGAVTFDRGRDGSFGETVTTSPATGSVNAFSPGFCGGAARGNAPAAGCDDDDEAYDFAIRAGYDMRVGSSLIVGALIEGSRTGMKDSATAFSTTPASYTFTRESDYVVALRGRLGFAPGPRGMIYATGGIAASKMDNSFTSTNTANSFTQNNADDWAVGYQAGGGVQVAVRPDVSIGLEYLYNDFKDDDYSVSVGTGTAGATNPFVLAGGVDMKPVEDSFKYHSVRATLSIGF